MNRSESANQPGPADAVRVVELTDGLATVRARIDAACLASGRSTDDVHLVVVTKTYPAADVLTLAGLGVTDVGESRDQEAAPKRTLVDAASTGLTWHCIGQVQTNKVRSIVEWADVVHSVDRPKLVTAFARAVESARGRERALEVLIQVSLDADTSRGGCLPSEVPPLADLIGQAQGLTLKGVMAVAPLDADPAQAFDLLRQVSQDLQEQVPGAACISAGMSADLEQAIAAGATHVRVGSAVLGRRPPVR